MNLNLLFVIVAILLLPFVLILLFGIFAWITTLFVKKEGFYQKGSKFYRFVMMGVDFVLLFLSNVRIHVRGMENVPEVGTRFLLVSNHRSNYDPLSTVWAFRRHNIAFVSKPQNFDLFICGQLARRNCFLSIDKDNARSSMETIIAASDLIKNDECSIAIYPEGMRSFSCELLNFHNGVFKIAQKANCPIVVCTVRGTELAKDRAPFRLTHFYIDVVETIPAADVKAMRTNDIGDRVRADFIKSLDDTNWK